MFRVQRSLAPAKCHPPMKQLDLVSVGIQGYLQVRYKISTHSMLIVQFQKQLGLFDSKSSSL